MRRFLWGTMEGLKKFHLVSCEAVCLPMELGGWGIKRMGEVNVALMCKWLWRIKEDIFWARLIKEKYGTIGNKFFPNFGNGSYGCSIWLSMKKVNAFFNCIT